jgi:hypothetical protein
MLLSDFNSYQTFWDCSSINAQEVSDLLLSTYTCLFIDPSATYMHPAKGSNSYIDLANGNRALYVDFNFEF